MITQGADALIIAAIDGTALSSQLQAAADADIPVISYDRLIRDSENVDFYVTLRQLQGRRRAGHRAARSASASLNEDGSDGRRAPGPFNIELFAGSLDDNNAALLLQRRDDGAAAEHRRRHARREVRPDRHRAGRDPALAAGDRAEAHGGPADRPATTTAPKRRRRAVARTTACRAASSPRCRTPATATGAPTRCRSSPARTPRSPRSSSSPTASRAPRSSRTPACSPSRPSSRPRRSSRATSPRRTTPRPTTTASRSSRRTCSSRRRLRRRHPVGAGRLRLLDGRRGRQAGQAGLTSHQTGRVRQRSLPGPAGHRPSRSPSRSGQLGSPAPTATGARPHPDEDEDDGVHGRHILEMRSITKTFPGVKALQDVSLAVRRGEIHAICGENGAGKSTLMKVLSGRATRPAATTARSSSTASPCSFGVIRDSEHAGIVIIHQELALVPYLSIAENIFLGNEQQGPQRPDRLEPGQRRGRRAARARSASTRTRSRRSVSSASASSSWSRSPRRCPRTSSCSSSTSRPPR